MSKVRGERRSNNQAMLILRGLVTAAINCYRVPNIVRYDVERACTAKQRNQYVHDLPADGRKRLDWRMKFAMDGSTLATLSLSKEIDVR